MRLCVTCVDTAICKHSLGFSIALVSFCTCTGSNMVMVQRQHIPVPRFRGSVYLRIPTFNVVGQNKLSKVKWKNHTILCQYRYGTVHLRSGKINKYLSGSNRERSIGDGMAAPEPRTRVYKKLVRKELKYSMYKNTYSQ